MTVSVPGQLIYAFNGDGSTQIFSYPVRFLADAELTVILQAADGTQSQKTLNTDYTVSDAGELNGGSVTMLTAPAEGEKLFLYRNTSPTQSVDLEDGVRTPAQSVEDQLDRLTMVEQDHADILKRAVKIQVGSSLSEGPTLPEPKDGDFLYWDGTKLGNHSVDGGLGNVVGPDSSTDGNFAVMSGTSGKIISDSGKNAASFVQPTATDASGYDFVINEDDMASDSATKLPTQASVKAAIRTIRVNSRSSAATLKLSGWDSVIVNRWSDGSILEPALYAPVDSEPSHDAWFQDSEGNYFALVDRNISPATFGAAMDGTTDDYDAFTRFKTFITYYATNSGAYGVIFKADGKGRAMASSKPLELPGNCVYEHFAFKALAGTGWSGNPDKTLFGHGNNGLVVIGPAATAYYITFRNNIIDCNYIDEVQGLYISTANAIVVQGNDIRHWADTGNGLIMDEGATAIVRDNTIFRVLGSGDADWGDQSKAYGMAIGLFDAWDSSFIGNSFGQCQVPLYCGPRSSMNRFIDNHPWQSFPGVATVWTDPYGIYYEGFRSEFIATYMDSCPFFHNVTTLTNADGYSVPQVTIKDTITIYAASASTFSSWYKMSTDVASTPLDHVIMDGNYWDDAIPPFIFAATGSGTYAMGTALIGRVNASRYDSQFLASRSPSWMFAGNTDFLGCEVRGDRISIETTSDTAYTLSDADSGELYTSDASSTVTITVPATLTKGFKCFIYLPSAGGSLSPASNAVINGSGSAIPLAQNKLYQLICFYSAGGSALYGLLGV